MQFIQWIILIGLLLTSAAQAKSFVNKLGMRFVVIPAGHFMMGAAPDADNTAQGEQPQHPVVISRPFYMGQFEVTQAQWVALMGDNPSLFKGHHLPVEEVSWYAVEEFIKRLNQFEYPYGYYRLPTEAEWEYAARAGSDSVYAFGDEPTRLTEYSWFEDNAYTEPHPVGQKKPNCWGLYDMYGNVWEWVQDWYDPDYYLYHLHHPHVDPQGPTRGNERVNRGCSWNNIAWSCRATFRFSIPPEAHYANVGFRLVWQP